MPAESMLVPALQFGGDGQDFQISAGQKPRPSDFGQEDSGACERSPDFFCALFILCAALPMGIRFNFALPGDEQRWVCQRKWLISCCLRVDKNFTQKRHRVDC
jgi:hypothetical protein